MNVQRKFFYSLLSTFSSLRQNLGNKFWRTRTLPIRTASQITAHIIIKPANDIPLYQKLAKKVAQLRLLGMSYLNISKKLNISEPTAIKADRFYALLRKDIQSPKRPKGVLSLSKGNLKTNHKK